MTDHDDDDDDGIEAQLAENRRELRFVNRILSTELVIRETVQSEVTETRALIMGRIDRLSDVITGIRTTFGSTSVRRKRRDACTTTPARSCGTGKT